MPDYQSELWGVCHLVQLAAMSVTNVRSAKAEFGLDERGIDVVFDFDGRRFGAQHTVFHFDEGRVPGKRGSPTRAMEEATARAHQAPFGMWVAPDDRLALAHRINEKIALAQHYDARTLVARPG